MSPARKRAPGRTKKTAKSRPKTKGAVRKAPKTKTATASRKKAAKPKKAATGRKKAAPARKKKTAPARSKKAVRKKAAPAKKKAVKKPAAKKAAAKKAIKEKPPAAKKAVAPAKKKAAPRAKKARKKASRSPFAPAEPASREPKPGLGYKWVCYGCAAKFYDLLRPQPVCPKCGANQQERPKTSVEPRPAPARPRRRPAAQPMSRLLDEEEVSEETVENDGDEEAAELDIGSLEDGYVDPALQDDD